MLQQPHPDTTIILELMAPGLAQVMAPQVTDYVDRLRAYMSVLVAEKSTASSAVMAVDMHTGLTEAMLANGVHDNEAGAVFIAERYRAVLAGILQDDRD